MYGAQPYPGHMATVSQVTALAAEYRGASQEIIARGKRGRPAMWEPARLLAVQAVDLELNAFLLHRAVDAQKLRGMLHDLAARGDLAEPRGLRLRRKTLIHLHELSSRREYLAARYGPEAIGSWTQITRLQAIVAEVSNKVASAVADPPQNVVSDQNCRSAAASGHDRGGTCPQDSLPAQQGVHYMRDQFTGRGNAEPKAA